MFVSRNKFRTVPDNTVATANINKAVILKTNDDMPYIKIYWSLIHVKYQGTTIRQNLYINNQNEEKKIRAKEMLKRIFKISNKILSGYMPTQQDLKGLIGTCAKLRISLFDRIDGEKSNWVFSVSKPDKLQYDVDNRQFFGRESCMKSYPKSYSLESVTTRDLEF